MFILNPPLFNTRILKATTFNSVYPNMELNINTSNYQDFLSSLKENLTIAEKFRFNKDLKKIEKFFKSIESKELLKNLTLNHSENKTLGKNLNTREQICLTISSDEKSNKFNLKSFVTKHDRLNGYKLVTFTGGSLSTDSAQPCFYLSDFFFTLKEAIRKYYVLDSEF